MLRFYEIRFGRPALEQLAERLGTRLRSSRTRPLVLCRELPCLSYQMVKETGDPEINYKADWLWSLASGRRRVYARALLSLDVCERHSITKLLEVTNWTIEEPTPSTIALPASACRDDVLFCRPSGLLESTPGIFGLPRARPASVCSEGQRPQQ